MLFFAREELTRFKEWVDGGRPKDDPGEGYEEKDVTKARELVKQLREMEKGL